MAFDTMKPTIKTRFLIISDTHGAVPRDSVPGSTSHDPPAFRKPLRPADVVLHCGDMTTYSKFDEFHDTFKYLREMDAPLKLVIGGNHDGLLDPNFVERQLADWSERPNYTPQIRENRYREIAEVRATIEDAKQDGVHYLEEGTYEFLLQNGAVLRLFASPRTPDHNSGGFQYKYEHDFPIQKPIDVAMTHGPAFGILDLSYKGANAGCRGLFRSLYKARPMLHCHGHIHEAWGAQLTTWKDVGDDVPTRANALDMNQTKTLVDLASMDSDQGVNSEDAEKRKQRRKRLLKIGAAFMNVCEGGETVLRPGEQMLSVNAAIMDRKHRPSRTPWVVDLELSRAEPGEEDS